MLRDLLLPLVKYFSALNIIKYLTFRAMYAAVTALLLCWLFGPRVIERLRVLKFGQSVRMDGPATHLVKSGTPTMGGVLIILSVAISVLLWQDLHTVYTWVTLGALLLFCAIGFADDYLKIKHRNSDGLSVVQKLVLQFLVAGGAVMALYLTRGADTTQLYIPFFKKPVLDLGTLWIPLAMIYVVLWSNAVNLTDGLDGLATGLVIMALVAFAALTYISGRADWSAYLSIPFIKGAGELTVFNLALIGACTGFLWFNAHPAEVFMGDAGSLALGGVLGVLSLIVKKELLLLVVGGMFILEALSVVLQVGYFKLTKGKGKDGNGKRLFRMAPLHHHFELGGWKETKVVVRFWILGGIFAILALTTLKIQ
ncbi:MAG: phospho-N-acetylmuramoyl-pentapeptide-transferase [Rectinemataceae bacterium]|nr:phospho-N-acetylmuramoyl-pentapeptide-transferase [Rectinemataceae bacterium]